MILDAGPGVTREFLSVIHTRSWCLTLVLELSVSVAMIANSSLIVLAQQAKKSQLIGSTRLVQIIAIKRDFLSDETQGSSIYLVLEV